MVNLTQLTQTAGYYYLNLSISNDNINFTSPLTILAYNSKKYQCSSETLACNSVVCKINNILRLIFDLKLFCIFLWRIYKKQLNKFIFKVFKWCRFVNFNENRFKCNNNNSYHCLFNIWVYYNCSNYWFICVLFQMLLVSSLIHLSKIWRQMKRTNYSID